MPIYEIEALEKFVVRTRYRDVEARNAEEAERLVRSGEVAYDRNEVEGGDDEYLETVSVEEIEADAETEPAVQQPGSGSPGWPHRFSPTNLAGGRT